MTKEEYGKAILVARQEYNRKCHQLSKQYAFDNNPYKVGDIVTDHIGSIIIESIDVWFGYDSDYPCCNYYGVEVCKNGKPNKRGSKRNVIQRNVEIYAKKKSNPR